jgi:fluoride exporter
MNFLYVFVGGGVGSLFRYLIGLTIQRNFYGNLPIATFISNVVACIILGSILYLSKSWLQENKWGNELLLIGLCGGLSTMSTFSKETMQLIEQGASIYAIANIVFTLLACLSILWILKFVS